MGKSWLTSIGKEELAQKISVASVADLPFKDNFFIFCVSHGVLDSMSRSIAIEGMREVKRVLRNGALMYLDLIIGTNHDGDEIVESGYEEGTIQSYFTVDTLKDFLKEFEVLDFIIITRSDDFENIKHKRAYLVIKNNK